MMTRRAPELGGKGNRPVHQEISKPASPGFRRHRHLGNLAFLGAVPDHSTGALDLPVLDHEKDLPAGFQDLRSGIAEDFDVRFFQNKVPFDPVPVQLLEGSSVLVAVTHYDGVPHESLPSLVSDAGTGAALRLH